MCRRYYNSKFNALINVLDMYMAVHEFWYLPRICTKTLLNDHADVSNEFRGVIICLGLYLLSAFDVRG